LAGLTAQRLLPKIAPLIKKVEGALGNARALERQQVQDPLEALNYQKGLLETQIQLQGLQKDMVSARSQLAALMNLSPAVSFQVAEPKGDLTKPPEVTVTPSDIERIALINRPELREESYQGRIGTDETRRAMLRLLPGLEFNYGLNYDSNSFLVNNAWADYGLRVSWNLLNLLSGPASIAAAEAQEEVNVARRLALSMAILTQSHVSWLRHQLAVKEWKTATELRNVVVRIDKQMKAAVAAERGGELEAILSEVDALNAELKAELAFADLQGAAGQVFVTMGADPLPPTVASDDLGALAAAIAETERAWFRGRPPVVATQAPPPAAAPEPVAPEPVPAASTPVPPSVALPLSVGDDWPGVREVVRVEAAPAARRSSPSPPPSPRA